MKPTSRITRLLDTSGVPYEVVPHRLSFTAMETAHVVHVPGRRLAKVIGLRDAAGRVFMAVLPASERLDLERIGYHTGRRGLSLMDEDELRRAFPDSKVGATPPLPRLYRVSAFIDACFREEEDVWFPAGNHRELVRMRYEDLVRIGGPFEREFCMHEETARAHA